MKRILVCITAAAVMLSGCSKSNEQPVAQTAPVQASVSTGSTAKAPAPVVKKGTIPSVMIAGGYWTLLSEGENAGKMKWVDYAVPGTVVYAFTPSNASSETPYEVMKGVVRMTDGQKRDFVHITSEDKDYWAQDYSIGVNCVPGLVTGQKSYLYKKPNPADISDKLLPAGTIIGVSEEAVDDSNPFASQYRKVYAYVENKLIEGLYLSTGDFSTTQSDLLGMQLYTKLTEKNKEGKYLISDEVARRELIATANSLNLSSFISEKISSVMYEEGGR